MRVNPVRAGVCVAVGLVILYLAVLWARVAPVGSSSSAREVFVAGLICDGKTHPLFPSRLDHPASKPPLYHWLLCGSAKALNTDPSVLLGRLVSLGSMIVMAVVSAVLLQESLLFYTVVFFMFYPAVDEGLDTKVDALSGMIVWFSALIFFAAKRLSYVLAPVLGFLIFAAKGLFSLCAFLLILVCTNFLKGFYNFRGIVLVSGLTILGGLLYPMLGAWEWGDRWISFETVERFIGNSEINPSPFYYYLQKLLSYVPVNICLFYAILRFPSLNKSSQRILIVWVVFMLVLSLSYGKRGNYILPVLPLLAKTSVDGFRLLVSNLSLTKLKDMTRVVRAVNGSLMLFILVMILLASTGGTVGIHQIDLILTTLYNNAFLISCYILSLALISFVNQSWMKLGFVTILVNITLAASSPVIKFAKNRWDTYVEEISPHCSKIGVNKNPSDERLDVLLLLLRNKVENKFNENDIDCILDLKMEQFRGFIVLKDNGWFRVLVRKRAD